jgi:hypothetical protein
MMVQLTAHSPHANPVIYLGRTPLLAHIQKETFFVNSFLHVNRPHDLRNRRRCRRLMDKSPISEL